MGWIPRQAQLDYGVGPRARFGIGAESSQAKPAHRSGKGFGPSVRSRREELGISVEMMVEATGMTREAYCRMEVSRDWPALHLVGAILRPLSLDPSKIPV